MSFIHWVKTAIGGSTSNVAAGDTNPLPVILYPNTRQVESITVTAACSGNGTIIFTVTSAMAGGSFPLSIAVTTALNTVELVADAIRDAISANTTLAACFTVGGGTGVVQLTALQPTTLTDSTLAMALTDASTTGITVGASTNTTAGGYETLPVTITGGGAVNTGHMYASTDLGTTWVAVTNDATGSLSTYDKWDLRGLYSAIPAASAGNLGKTYLAVDTGIVYLSNGTTWAVMSTALAGGTAKPQASFTRPNSADAIHAGDIVGTNPATNMTFASVIPILGGQFYIASVTLEIDVNAIPAGMGGFRLHLYDAAPTAIADGTAFNLPAADRDKYLGYITLATPVDIGDTLWSQNDNLNFSAKLAAGSSTIYGMLETLGAYTATAQAVKRVTIYPLSV